MKKLAILFFVVFLIIGCHSSSEKNMSYSIEDEATLSTEMDNGYGVEDVLEHPPQTESLQKIGIDNRVEKGSKIIKEGFLTVEVKDLNSAKIFIDSIVHVYSAYYEKEVFRNSEYTQNYSLKLRIPSSNFNTLIARLEEGEGVILEKNINAKDVTAEYLDVEIRLENNKAYLKRYNELLKKAKTIKEMLQIQEKIQQIEMAIDVNMGRIKYLSDRVDYSTLSIDLNEKYIERLADAPPTFFDRILKALKNGFSGLLYFILILANLWPVLLGLIFIWMFRNRFFGFMKKKNRTSS